MARIEASKSPQKAHAEPSSPNMSSSPPRAPVASPRSKKLKKPPPITPKRFNKFFTPRSISGAGRGTRSTGKSGRQLRDITRNALNRNVPRSRRSRKTTALFGVEEIENVFEPVTPSIESSRKRKVPLTPPDSSPLQPTPTIKRVRIPDIAPTTFHICEDEESEVGSRTPSCEREIPYPKPIFRARLKGPAHRILSRSFGDSGAGRRLGGGDYCTYWQNQTANFFTGPDDVHHLRQGAVPFCTTSCNLNSLVAIGDEDGWVRLLDTSQSSKPGFSSPHLSFRPHNNALMDLAFSSDDFRLATASGDQTAQVIDIRSQSTLFVLAKHASSVKQICFQPGNDQILATCSRDGTVQLWDLRCSGKPAHSKSSEVCVAKYADTVNTIGGAHADRLGHHVQPTAVSNTASRDAYKTDPMSRRNEPSVTALTFLPEGRGNILVTASDASSCVRLWDIRSRYSRRSPATPISTTRPLESHSRYRHFGINSLALSSDGARLYALSRDSTVYAYSTNHLVLGHAPELSSTKSRYRSFNVDKEGLGPLYGFRHEKLHATTFYVKAALRRSTPSSCELLAVGSSQGCPILFTTDERLLEQGSSQLEEAHSSTSPDESKNEDDNDLDPFTPPSSQSSTSSTSTAQPLLLRRTSSFQNSFASNTLQSPSTLSARLTDTIPIYSHGTALIRGHSREVTSVAWTQDGELVSASDDWSVRCWRDGTDGEARNLRLGGEAEGRRWACGWADIKGDFDDEEL